MEGAFANAKAYLLKSGSGSSGAPESSNVYEHLTAVIAKLLTTKPENPLEVLEDVSREIRAEAHASTDQLRDADAPQGQVTLAKAQTALFKPSDVEEEVDEESQSVVPDLMETASLLEDCGVGIGRADFFRIYLSMKQLAEQQPLKTMRFFGKIFGLEASYYVVEAQFREGEEPQPEEDEAADEEPAADDNGDEEHEGPPKSKFQPPPPVPAEEYGSGTNRNVYFVCNEPGGAWTMLPNVTPAQITVARQVKKYFTGRLDSPVISYPPFPGNEANLLRAQLARIAAATTVSPMGFYTFDEDEDDEEARENYIVDEEFEGKSRTELLDPSLSGWVHHAGYILPQGRCRWINPVPEKEDMEEEEEEEEEEEAEVEPETGPPLLSPLQNDDEVDGMPAWTTKLSSQFNARYACVCISSNRWPGAHAVAVGRKFQNFYVGFGHKFEVQPYSPPLPPFPEQEYPNEADIAEGVDPTRDEEEAYEASQQQEEEGEEEEEGDDGEEDED